jgi:hypothetical protein
VEVHRFVSEVILEAPIRNWKCPSCGIEDQTQRADAHTQFHNCPALGDVSIPLVEVRHLDEKVKARQLAVERDDGPGLASIRTERLDGSNDCTVFPSTAVIDLKGT